MSDDSRQVVFFVDDEAAIRKQVARTLETLDVEVECFASARECLEQLRDRDCSLLITDVKMPDMDGVELLASVRDIVPSLPVLIIVGLIVVYLFYAVYVGQYLNPLLEATGI